MNAPIEHLPEAAQSNVLCAALLASFGGAVKYISGVIRSAERISNRRFLFLLAANIFISSFCGLMGGLLVNALTNDTQWAYIGSGLIGYLGTQGMDIVLLSLQKKIGLGKHNIASIMPVPEKVLKE
jgi:hypothetical protein